MNEKKRLFLKNQFWSFKLISESWFKWKEVESYTLKNLYIKKAYIKTYQKIIKFDDTEIEEHKFHQHKKDIWINDIDINKTVIPNMFPFGKQDFKHSTGYKDNKKIRSLCIFIPEMCVYKDNLYVFYDKRWNVFWYIYENFVKSQPCNKKDINSELKKKLNKNATQNKALNVRWKPLSWSIFRKTYSYCSFLIYKKF